MFLWRPERISWIDVVLVMLVAAFLFLFFGRGGSVEVAEGFHVVRPTYWIGTPTEINVVLTSFYPERLECNVSAGHTRGLYVFEPRGSVTVRVRGTFPPNRLIAVPMTVDCGKVKENGSVRVFIFTESG